MANSADTFERSCDHWSEAGRPEMEDFYALASVDYRHLAKAIDWNAWFRARQKAVGTRSLRLLDVACGSGKFPAALASDADISSATASPVDYALLDPSSFSISEARQALAAPFQAGAEYEMTLQDFECHPGSFDIVWATHALYAIPYNELEIALSRMLNAMGYDGKPENIGAGFIAHASSQSHYLQFYQYYLSGFKGGIGAPYTSAEQIVKMLTQIGLSAEIREIDYTNGASQDKERQVERYLQRCLFDDTVTLKEMLSNPITGPYLETCRNNGKWQFAQRVSLIFVNTSAGSIIR